MEGKKRVFLLFAAVILVSLACSVGGASEQADAPVVSIVMPAESESFSIGQVVNVVATATSEVGIQKVELLVNGQLFSTQDVTGAPTSHSLSFAWTPAVEGAVVLGVIAYDTENNDSEPALVTVQITSGGGGGQPATQAPESPTEEPAQQTVVCTPPPCGANEAYFCPGGSCPGGCGITCATFTPTIAPPTATFTPVPPTNTFTPSPTNTLVWINPSIQIVVSLQVFQLATVETVYNQESIPAGSTGTASVTCPANTVVVSGGYAAHTNVFIYNHHKSGNGWQAYAMNNAASPKTISVYARCLKNTSGTTQEVMKQDTINGNSHANISKNCPAGSIVTGGGYAVNHNGNTNIYNSSQSGNGWQVWGDNTSGSGQLVNLYAVCLSGVNATTSQHNESFNIPAHGTNGGYSACPDNKLAVGGGFAAQMEYYMYNTSPHTAVNSEWTAYAYNPTGTANIIFNYAICLDFN